MMGVVQSMIPVIDGLFISNLAGTIAYSAVSYCVPIVNVIAGLAQGLSMAGMAIIGQANGRGDIAEGKRISTQMIVFSSLLGVVLAPVLYGVAYPISASIDPQISAAVFQYLTLSMLVIPFSFLESIYNAIKNANGKPEATFIRMIILLILKVLFNFLFIAVLKWGLTGAVMSSLAANMLITVWMYYELFVMKSSDRLSLKNFKFERYIIKDLVRIGTPSMLTGVMLNLGFFLINNEVQKYGAIVIAGQGIANNITGVCFNIPSCFGAAVTTMVSMNIGAGNKERAKISCWKGCLLSAISAALLIIIIVPLSSRIAVLFTPDMQEISFAESALHIYTYSVIGFGVGMVQMGAYIGLGRTKMPLFIGFLRIWLLRYLFILATEKYLGVYSVFWGNLFSNYLAAAITTILVLRVKWVSVIGDAPTLKARLYNLIHRIRHGKEEQKEISA